MIVSSQASLKSTQKEQISKASRVARSLIVLPAGVSVIISDHEVRVKGPKGEVVQLLPSGIYVEQQEAGLLVVARAGVSRALPGTLRALIHNHVVGVSAGFLIKLRLVGVGYRAQANKQGDGSYKLDLSLGFSHPVVYQAPVGVALATPIQTEIEISGVDKQLVGQVAANIRAYRPPEPYKGKGIRYILPEELIILKEPKKTK